VASSTFKFSPLAHTITSYATMPLLCDDNNLCSSQHYLVLLMVRQFIFCLNCGDYTVPENGGLRTERYRKTRQDSITKSSGFQVFVFVSWSGWALCCPLRKTTKFYLLEVSALFRTRIILLELNMLSHYTMRLGTGSRLMWMRLWTLADPSAGAV
jgi:hypothetical protein